jgi:PAS domain S-box-containing protein
MRWTLSPVQRHPIALITRVTPYSMVGHLLNTTILTIAVAGSVPRTQLIIWCIYSYSIALLLLYRHQRNRRRSPHSFQIAAKKATIYALFLALPWSSLAVLYLGALSQDEELILIALGIGMAASGTILLSAVPAAAFIYMSAILIPSALKCLVLNQKGYLLLGALALSCWGFLTALIVKITRDISDRKRAEEALTERNAQLALAGKAGLVGSYAYDADTEIMQISEGYAAIHGFPESIAEIARRKCLAGVHPDDLGLVERLRSEAFRERQREYSVEYRIIRSGGELRWVETRCCISYDGEGCPKRVVGVSIDITERKLAEQALAERNAQFDLAHKTARVGCYTYDIPAGTVRFSRASAATYGLSQRTMEITAQQWLARVHRDDVQRLRAEHTCAFNERRRELTNEYRFVRPGGEIRWIEARSLVAYDPAGRAERMTGVYIDVTERRQGEDHKNLLIAELDHRVKNVLACVGVVAQRTRETAKSMDEFLEVLEGRLLSLANTHALLSRSRWQGVSLAELVRSELAPCMKDGNTFMEGPDIVLAAEAAQPVAMVLHELATNATKYGALSNGHGRVSVSWENTQDWLSLRWCEAGVPPIASAGPSGYGSSLIRDLIPYELGGSVDYALSPEGVRCRVAIPAKWLSNSKRSRRDRRDG